MAADLSGVDAKIAWSKAHFATLTAAIDDTIKRQPYRGPDGQPANYAEDALWRLHRLDIIDKHRLLLVVGAALNVGGMWWGWWGEHEPPAKVFLNSSPLNEGDVVARFDVRGCEPPPEWDPHPDISIILHEAPTLDLAHLPVVSVLDSLVRWVDDYILYDNFRALFST